MNNKKRELLRGAINHLDAALRIVESVLDKESDSLENLPDNLQNSELCDRIERAVSLPRNPSKTQSADHR